MAQVKTYPQTQLEIGWQIKEEYDALLVRKKANRELLRNMLASDPGAFTEDEAVEIDELYPLRVRKDEDGAENDAAAAASAEDAATAPAGAGG